MSPGINVGTCQQPAASLINLRVCKVEANTVIASTRVYLFKIKFKKKKIYLIFLTIRQCNE